METAPPLTRSLVEAKAEEYAAVEGLHAVEDEQLETLPAALAAGDYGWRDVEWVVRWTYRRYLGAYPDDRRRAVESAFGENGFEAVRDALAAAGAADTPAEALDALTDLAGVDVVVASALLMFLDPAAYLVGGDREWTVLHEAGELDGPFPEPVTAADYRRYLETARAVADRLDCPLWTLYRALWRLWVDRHG